jgi:hypothetical protein
VCNYRKDEEEAMKVGKLLLGLIGCIGILSLAYYIKPYVLD